MGNWIHQHVRNGSCTIHGLHNRLTAMKWTPIPDQKTRERYIAHVIDIYADAGKTLTVEQANKEAERLYHLVNDDWLSEYKEWIEDKMCGY